MRPIWSGSISFDLVSVPVRMFPVTEFKELRLHFLHKLRESVERMKNQPQAPSKRKAS